MSAMLDDDVAELQRAIAKLQRQLDERVAERDGLLAERNEALARETATAEVLQVINSSPGDLAPVFDAILEKARAVCGFAHGSLNVYDGEYFRTVAMHGYPEAFAEVSIASAASHRPQARFLEGDRIVHIGDVATERPVSDDPAYSAAVEAGVRTVFSCRCGTNNGCSATSRPIGGRSDLSPKEIALLENLAAQAVIAMENAHLLDEIRQRQAELRVTFDNMDDAVAMFDHDLRLIAWNRNFQQLIDLPDEVLEKRPTYADYLHILAERGEFGTEDVEAELARRLGAIDQELRRARIRPDGRVLEVRRSAVPDGGFILIYSDITDCKRSETEIKAAQDAAGVVYRDLKAAQANCIAPGIIVTGGIMATLIPGSTRSNQDRAELVALQRFGTVEDCAEVVEFLATDLSDYVTGAVIPVDGGLVRR